MKLHFHALCAVFASQSVVSFAPQNRPAFLSIAQSSSTCSHMMHSHPLSVQRSSALFMSSVKEDGETIQALFSSHCDKDGLMTKNTLQTDISAIKELLVRFYILMFAPIILHRFISILKWNEIVSLVG